MAYLDGVTRAVEAVQALHTDRVVHAVIIDPHSGAATLIRPLTAEGIKVSQPTSAEIAEAHGLFLDKLKAGELRHVEDPRLDAAVHNGTTRRLGRRGHLGPKRSDPPISHPSPPPPSPYGPPAPTATSSSFGPSDEP